MLLARRSGDGLDGRFGSGAVADRDASREREAGKRHG
jgi:hypothetical protein